MAKKAVQTAPDRGRTWVQVKKDLDQSIVRASTEGEDDIAFKRFVHSALNGDTQSITGWTDLDTKLP
jgi:hypothetical protein